MSIRIRKHKNGLYHLHLHKRDGSSARSETPMNLTTAQFHKVRIEESLSGRGGAFGKTAVQDEPSGPIPPPTYPNSWQECLTTEWAPRNIPKEERRGLMDQIQQLAKACTELERNYIRIRDSPGIVNNPKFRKLFDKYEGTYQNLLHDVQWNDIFTYSMTDPSRYFEHKYQEEMKKPE